MLIVALNNIPDCYSDGLAILARVRLRWLAPAPVKQRLGGGHTGRRGGGPGAADTCQRADGQRGLRPRQRSNICCSLSHLGSFALRQFGARAAGRACHRLGWKMSHSREYKTDA
jgi:hypothetical protein